MSKYIIENQYGEVIDTVTSLKAAHRAVEQEMQCNTTKTLTELKKEIKHFGHVAMPCCMDASINFTIDKVQQNE